MRRVRLDQVVEIQLGKMLSPASRAGTRPIPYIRNANVQWNRLDLSQVHEMDFDEDEEAKFQLLPGDVLVCEGGEPGRAAVWRGEIGRCCYQKALHRLRPIPGVIDPEYLVFRLWFGNARGEFDDGHAKTTIAHLPAVRLAALQINLPTLSEQRRTAVAFIDQLAAVDRARDSATARLRQSQKLPDAVRDALLSPLRSLPSQTLADMVNLGGQIADGPFGSNLKTDHYAKAGARVIRLQNIGLGVFLGEDAAFISSDHFAGLARHDARAGDVVVAALGDGARPAGRACVVPNGLGPALVKADCFRIRAPDDRLDPEFLMQFLNAPTTRGSVAALMRGATRPRFTLAMLRRIPIPRIPLAEQHRIAAKLRERLVAIEAMTKSIEAELKAIEALPAALLRRAFDEG